MVVDAQQKPQYELAAIALKAFERATGETVPYTMGDRRSGDVVSIWADASRAKEELGWTAERSLEEALADAWRWQQRLKTR